MNQDIIFGQVVKERRSVLGLTQTELAGRIGCATITIRKIEADALRPSVQLAELIAVALNIPDKELFAFVRLARTESYASPIPTPSPAPEEIGQPDLSGRAIKGFQLGEKIGSGGFGVVYRATQPSVDRDVAIKIILPRYANHPNFIRRFEAEAQLIAHLEHPHIVPLYDYWRDPGAAYLIMRLLRGGSLEDQLKAGPVPLNLVYQYTQHIGLALDTAHRHGIIHRDIKPANVLLDEEGNAYLADFGIAKNLDDWHGQQLTEAGAMIGSPAYISPEQIMADPVKPQSDIYGLGIMLFEMLTGHKPYTGPTPVAYIQQHLNETLPSVQKHNPELPTALDAIIQQATARNMADRFPDVISLLGALQLALPVTNTVISLADSTTRLPDLNTQEMAALENPYKGLRAFAEADAEQFHGRSPLIQEIFSQLSEQSELARFLAIVGPSGSGKSSVVKAGLIPALRRGGLPCSEDWFIIDFTPGSKPWEEVEAALLRVAVNPPDTLLAQLQDGNRGLLSAIQRILPDDGETELVMVIDQFEELFTLTPDETIREQFLNSLITAVLDPHSRLRLIITLRADFYDRPLQYVDFGDLLRQRTISVLPMTPEELEQAIVQPAAQIGIHLEQRLATTIMHDGGDQPGTLPLLQYTLTELFEQRDRHKMTYAAYEAMGGITGALTSRAEEIFAGLDAANQAATRQLFLRMVTLGEGVEDTRRRVRLTELESLSINDETAIFGTKIPIDEFGRYRLLTFDHDPITREPTVEVAHEALLREWTRLRDWLKESRDDIRLERLLATATNEWVMSNRDPGFLLRDARLDQFATWGTTTTLALTADEQDFLDVSIAARHQRETEEEARRQREIETAQHLAQTERQRAEEQSQAASTLRRRAYYLGGALLIAAFLALLALAANRQSNLNAQEAQANLHLATTRESEANLEAFERATAEAVALAEASLRATAQTQADTQRDNAIAAEATAQAETFIRATAEAAAIEERQDALHQASIGFASQAVTELAGKFPERAVPLALEALEKYPYTWQAERALGQAVLENRLASVLNGHTDYIYHTAWAPDSQHFATASADGTAIIWNWQTNEPQLSLLGHQDAVYHLAWSPAGDKIVTSSADGTARIWASDTGEERFVLDHKDEVNKAVWSPDGDRILTASADGTAKVWDADSGENIVALGEVGDTGIFAIAWHPNGIQMATGDVAGNVFVWDSTTGQALFALEGHEDWVNEIQWSPTGDRIVTASDDQTARLWNADTGEPIHILAGHTGWIPNALWSPQGDRIATSAYDKSVRMWNADTGESLFVFDPGDLLGDVNYPNYLAWSPDGQFLATSRYDGTISILNADTGSQIEHLTGHNGLIQSLAWSPSGDYLVTSSDDLTARVWDVSQRAQILNHEGVLSRSDWSPDGKRLATASFNGTAKIWDTITWEELLTIPTGESTLWMLRWQPSGDHIVTRNFAGHIQVWDPATGRQILTVSVPEGLGGLAWSPTTPQFVTGDADGNARVWDAQTGETVMTFTRHRGAQIVSAGWSPDGETIVTSDSANRAMTWNAKTGELLRTFQVRGSDAWMTQATWSPTGKYIATHSDDPVGGRIWDVDTGELIQTFTGHSGSVWSLEWSNLGNRILSAAGDGTARVWDVDTGAELLVYTFPDWPMGLWSPDNEQIAFPLGDGTIWIIDSHWQTPEELIIYAHDCCLMRELRPEEREQFGLPIEP